MLSQEMLSGRGISLAGLLTRDLAVTKPSRRAKIGAFRELVPFVSLKSLKKLIDPHNPNRSLVLFDKGTEASVFKDKFGNVYKLTPITKFILDIPFVRGDTPLYAKLISHPLCSQLGAVTILNRTELMAGLPGFAATEVVGIAETGHVITKQPHLGDIQGDGFSWSAIQSFAAGLGLRVSKVSDADAAPELFFCAPESP